MQRKAILALAVGGLTLGMNWPAQGALMVHWALDEASGTAVADAAIGDGAQDGTSAAASPQWLPGAGIIGGGLRFGATAQTDVDENVSFTTTSELLADYPVSFSSWIRTTSNSTLRQTFVYFGDQSVGSEYLQTSLDPSPGNTGSAAARNTTFVHAVGGPQINDGLWHHVVGAYASATSRTLYVDGVQVATNATSVNFPDTTRLSLGALMRSSPTDAYNGDMDDVGLWNETLTPKRIALIHGLGRFGVNLGSTAIGQVESVFDAQSGQATAGPITWKFASGLPSSTIGARGTLGADPYIVLDASGNGVIAVPEPAALSLIAIGSLGLLRRRR